MTQIDPATTEAEPAQERRGGSHGVAIFLRDIVLILLAAIIISMGIKAFLIRSFYIPSESMQDTLQVDDRIIVNELVPDLIAVEHGDVVVFTDPGGWLTASPEPQTNGLVAAVDWLLSMVGISAPDSNDHLIKRVIGLPGDTVKCCNAFGQMEVNGIPLNEPYLKLPPGVTKVSANDFEVTVPAGSLWVMGDNRYDSADSRFNVTGPTKGFVPMGQVVGKAFVVSWPAAHWTWLGNYPQVFDGVDEGTDQR
ncbi:signal peptidase I [soil metagenome]